MVSQRKAVICAIVRGWDQLPIKFTNPIAQMTSMLLNCLPGDLETGPMVQTMPERRVLPARLRMSSPPRKSTLVAASRASLWPDGTSLSGKMDWKERRRDILTVCVIPSVSVVRFC